jgi:type II secretory pathway component PulM
MTLGFDTANQWWRLRSTRERGLLLLLVALGLTLIAWYGMASPLRRAAQQSDMHRANATQLLREVESARTAMDAIVIPSDAELEDVLKLSAAEADFVLETYRDESAREISVSGHAADPAALFGWITMLRRNHGLVVANLTVVRDENGVLRVETILMRDVS